MDRALFCAELSVKTLVVEEQGQGIGVQTSGKLLSCLGQEFYYLVGVLNCSRQTLACASRKAIQFVE